MPYKLQTVQKRFLSPAKLFVNYRKSSVPEGGWTHEAFVSSAGVALTRDLMAVQNAAKIKGTRLLAAPLAKVMKAQVLEVLAIMKAKLERSFPVRGTASLKAAPELRAGVIVLQNSQHAELWAAAIEQAFADEGHTVLATVRGPLQSVADDVLEKTTTLLTGTKPHAGTRRTLQLDMNEISKEVTNINETTRKNLSKIIANSINEGKHPFAVMEIVRDKLPQIATNRVPTIVRTEMGRAVDAATIRSMKEGDQVSHVSVIGCQAIEKGSPTFNGVPTCNIKNVPIESASSLRFHPNHTGAIVASGFKKEDGGRPELPLRQGAPIGTWEDRNRPVPALFNEQPPGPPGGAPPPRPTPVLPTPPAPPPVVPKPTPVNPAPEPIVTPPSPPAPMPPHTPVDRTPRWNAWDNPHAMETVLTAPEEIALDAFLSADFVINESLRAGSALGESTRNNLSLIDNLFDQAPVAPAGTNLRAVMLADEFEELFGGKTTWVDDGIFIPNRNLFGSTRQVLALEEQGYVSSEIINMHIELDGKALPVWDFFDDGREAYREMILPRGSHFALIRRTGNDVYLKVTTPGRDIIAPPIPKPAIPAKPIVAKSVDLLERRAVGHLTTSWKSPSTTEGLHDMHDALTADRINLKIVATNGMTIQTSDIIHPLAMNDAVLALADVQKMLGMSPMEWKAKVLSKLDHAAFSGHRMNMTIEVDRKRIWFEINSELKNGKGYVKIERQFRYESGAHKVHHNYLTIPEDAQGDDIAKKMSTSMLAIYDHLGVKSIDMLANISVGGYAWARYGFLPSSPYEWKALRNQVISRWNQFRTTGSAVLDPLTNHFTAAELDKIQLLIDAIAADDDVHAVRSVAGLRHATVRKAGVKPIPGPTLGKELLLGTSWDSILDLELPEAYTTYRRYID